MDPHRGGNLQNEITHEEHDHTNRAKRVNVVAGSVGQATVNINGTPTVFVGTPTLYAVVNTGAAGVGNSIVTVANTPLDTQIVGNVTISDSKGFIGLVTAVGNFGNTGNTTLAPSPNFIGIVTVANPSSFTGNVTLDAGSKTQIAGNLTLSDPKGFIGLVTVVGSLSPAAGNVTLDAGSKTGIVGNLTLSDSKTFIGLVTANIANSVGNATLNPSPNFIGIVTVANPSSFTGNVTLDGGSRTGIVGNVTIDSIGSTVNTSVIGNVTVDQVDTVTTVTAVTDITNPVALKGNLTLSNSKNYIGLVTVSIGDENAVAASFAGNVTLDSGSLTGIVGNVTVDQVDTVVAVTDITNPVAIKGNLTISDSKTYVGLTTSTLGVGTRFVGLVTAVQGEASWTVDVGTALPAGDNNIGNVDVLSNTAWANPDTFIGLVTSTVSNTARSVTGNLTLSDPKGFIGLVTVVGSLSPAAGNVTLDAGSRTGIVGNLTLSDPKGFIGLVTVVGSLSPAAGNTTLDTGSLTGIRDASGDEVDWADTVNEAVRVNVVAGGAGDGSILDGVDTGIKASVQSIADGRYLHVGIKGNSTVLVGAALPAGDNNIGNVDIVSGTVDTVTAVTDITNPVAIKGNLTLSDSKTFIGLVSVGGGVLNTVTAVTDITNPVGIKGNLTLSDSKTFVGLVSVSGFTTPLPVDATGQGDVPITLNGEAVVLGAGVAGIGFATVKIAANDGVDIGNVDAVQSGTWTVQPGNTANTTPWLVSARGNVTLSDAKTYVGLTTTTLGIGTQKIGLVTLSSSNANIGSVSILGGIVNVRGNVTLSDSKTFVGLVTAWTRNAGTTKTLVNLPVAMSTGSLATIAVPTNNQKINVTNLVLNSDATVRVSIKSGVTYLTGNASIGVTLNPGGGWIQTGSPDSPSWIGLPSGALVIEKFDKTATVASVGGNVVYFDE